ncbi:MAG: FtsB family cell division protein [Bacteroidota bacterium]
MNFSFKKVKLKKVLPYLKNRYFMTAFVFLIWMAFFDKNDMFTLYSYKSELHKLQADKEYYTSEIEKNKADMQELMSDPEHLEKYAREHYLMKRDSEDIFLFVKDSTDEEVKYEE